MRSANIARKTAETDIMLDLNLDGSGKAEIDTGVGFLNHMLCLFAAHGRFDLKLKCIGDTDVDDHHSVEDIGICLGRAFLEALGNCRGICRYGSIAIPMDETLVLVAADVSGRGFLGFNIDFPTEKIGVFDTQLIEEFWLAFTRSSGITLHFQKFSGKNSHHIAEGAFKAAARCLRMAVSQDPSLNDEIPSTKGMI